MSKSITILLIIGLILLISFVTFAKEEKQLKAPGGLTEFTELGRKFLEALPEAFEAAWKAVLDIWRKLWEWLENLWDSYIFPWFEGIWQKIFSFSEKEFEKRKALLGMGEESKEESLEEEPLEEEKIPEEKENLWKKLWERLTRLIK